MSYVDILAVEVLDNPAKFQDPLKFKITFQCKIKPQEGAPSHFTLGMWISISFEAMLFRCDFCLCEPP